MPTTDPLLQGNVLLDIDGVGVVAKFTSVSGISSEVEIVDNPYVTEHGKIIDRQAARASRRPPTITLKRGLDRATELWDWHDGGHAGHARTAATARSILMNTEGAEVARYNFTNALVSKLSLSEGGATASGVQIEEASLVCETLIKG